MKVVVGLGNPGREYAGTRHNVGYEVLAELSRRHGGGRPASKFEGELVDVMIGSEKTQLLAPQTYMNCSGRAIRQAVDFYKLELEDLLVVCDDMDLDCGRLRLRPKGSAGGQKGLADTIRTLGSQDFARLRIGIGRPPGRMAAADYVLGRFLKEQRQEIDFAVPRAADAVEKWIQQGIDAAMNAVNAPPE